MRTLFIGGTKRSYLTLKALLEHNAHIVGILCLQQDEHEIERYEEPIRELANQFGIPHYETKWMKDRDYAEIISTQMRPDVAFVVGCRILIPEPIYKIPPIGSFAVHDSLLPDYRGFAPLNWSIINDEDHTGVTLFYLSELMDGGDIVAQKRVPIGPDDTAPVVYDRVCRATVDVILGTYSMLASGTAPRIKQDYEAGSFTCSRNPIDGVIDWSKTTRSIYNQIRALTHPYPGAFTYYEGKRLIIWLAKPVDRPLSYKGRIPGRIIGISNREGCVDVLTGDGVLRILEVQAEGMDSTQPADVIKSVRQTLGLSGPDLLERIEALEQEIIRLKEGQS